MEDNFFYTDTKLDLSFTSTTTDRTFPSSSARTSLTLSLNDRLSSSSATTTTSTAAGKKNHQKSDPRWSAIKAATALSSDSRLHLRHLKLLRLLGSGNLGRVFLCHLRDCTPSATSCFALKVVDRDSLSPKKLSHVQTEADILSTVDHPFLPTLYARIDASRYSCLLIDYCSNGDLHSLLYKQPGNRLPIPSVRFFASEVLIALEYLHALGIIYRDLKPENVLLREDGHIMLSDFDLCFTAEVLPTLRNRRVSMAEMVVEFTAEPMAAFSPLCVGTHEYLAPEIIAGSGHGASVDWWAFGVFIFELLYGTTPFKGDSKEITLRNIAFDNEPLRSCRVANGKGAGTREATDLIEKLLAKDPRERLGCTGGAQDIKRHPFFSGIKWPLIRHYKPPPEVRRLVVKKTSSHVGQVWHLRPRWWRGLGNFNCLKNGRNYSNNNSYYQHVRGNMSSKISFGWVLRL